MIETRKQKMKHLLKSALISALILGTSMSSVAVADKLDPKWSAARKQANRLGDAAKAGQRSALQTLMNMANNGDAIAKHNIGWLYSKGFPGVAANSDIACNWYSKAVKQAYPPSMHAYAHCLLKQSKGQSAKLISKKLATAIALMTSAARKGWTNSSLYLSGHYALPLVVRVGKGNKSRGKYDINTMKSASFARLGLRTNPSSSQKIKLSYQLGFAAAYDMGVDRKEGHQALLFAFRNRHLQAREALEKLEYDWLYRLNANSHGLLLSEADVKTRMAKKACFKKAKNHSIDLNTRIGCTFLESRERRDSAHLYELINYLKANFKIKTDGITGISKRIREANLKNKSQWKKYDILVERQKKSKKLR